jgi:hypothetical protein
VFGIVTEGLVSSYDPKISDPERVVEDSVAPSATPALL